MRYKTVVSLVELVACQLDVVLVSILQLRPQTLAHGIPHFNHAANAKFRLNRQMRQRNQLVTLADGNLIVVDGIGVGFDMTGRGDGLFRCGDIQRTIERFINFCGQMFNRIGQRRLNIPAIIDQRRFVARIHPAFQLHLAQHHVRLFEKILVNRNDFAFGVGMGNDFFPFSALCGFPQAQFF